MEYQQRQLYLDSLLKNSKCRAEAFQKLADALRGHEINNDDFILVADELGFPIYLEEARPIFDSLHVPIPQDDDEPSSIGGVQNKPIEA